MLELDDAKAVIMRSESLWNLPDYAGLQALWDFDDPDAWYVAEEIEAPLVGREAIVGYWHGNTTLLDRIAVRVSDIRLKRFGPDGVAALYDLRWDLKLAGPRRPIGGDNRVSALLRRTPMGWRFCNYVEAPLSAIVYVRRLYEKDVGAEFAEALAAPPHLHDARVSD